MKKIAVLLLVGIVLSGSAWFAVLKPSESSSGSLCYEAIVKVSPTGGLEYPFRGSRVHCPTDGLYGPPS